MCVLEIRSVQPSVRDRAEFADEVIAVDVTDEAVCVGETETQTVAERRQQAIVIELVHNELRKFEYGTADGDRLREDCLCAKVFHHRQIGVDDRRALVGRFRYAAYKFRRIGNQMNVGAFSHVFHRLAIKRAGNQFVQRRLEFGLLVFPTVVAKFDKRQHVCALSERDDAVNLVQYESVGEIELQTTLVRDVAQIRDQFRAWKVSDAGDVLHQVHRVTKHLVEDVHMFGH